MKEQMAGLGALSVRRMFGGAGVFSEGLMFALVVDDVLFLKADETTKPAFESEGLEPFTFGAKGGKRTVMSYWRAPARCLDDPDEMASWGRKAQNAARRASQKKR